MSDDYPRMIFHPDGRTARVADPDEEKAAGDGWSREPSPVHRQTAGGSVMAYGQEPMAIMIRDVLERVLDERGIGTSAAQRAVGQSRERAEQANHPNVEFPARGSRRPQER